MPKNPTHLEKQVASFARASALLMFTASSAVTLSCTEPAVVKDAGGSAKTPKDENGGAKTGKQPSDASSSSSTG